MKLYKWYSPKNVKHPISIRYVVNLHSSNKLVISLGTFHLFPELYVQIPIGISNETV